MGESNPPNQWLEVGVGMLQYEIKLATTHVSLVTGWLLTIGGIIGLVLPILPGLPFLLLGLAILSKRQAFWMGAMGHDVAAFIVSSIKR